MAPRKRAPATGPRGGTTTRSKSGNLVRKAFWVRPEEAELLRKAAFDERRAEATIIRQLLRAHFGLPPAEDDLEVD